MRSLGKTVKKESLQPLKALFFVARLKTGGRFLHSLCAFGGRDARPASLV